MSKITGFDALRKAMNARTEEFERRPLSIKQRCSFLESGFTAEEINSFTQGSCKDFEGIVFNRPANSFATMKQMMRLLEMYEVDLARIDCDRFAAADYTYEKARKSISECL